MPINPGLAGFGLRFITVYLLLYAVPYGLWILPAGRALRERFIDAILPLVRAFGAMFGTEVTRPFPGTGSGDTLFDWVLVLLFALVALVTALVWSVWRGWSGDLRQHALWLRLVIRYGLAGNMFAYGLVKFTLYQFPVPGPERLQMRFGDSSPMNLLWTFMGAAPAYGWFTGCVEVGGALLLLWRRTALLGALIVTAALTNILLLNLNYDVPAKLFVAHLLAAALFLLWLDRTRLLDFFVRSRPLAAADLQIPDAAARLGAMHAPLKGIVVAALFAPILWQQGWFVHGKAEPGSRLDGAYRVIVPDGGSDISNPAVIVIDGGSVSLWDRDGTRGPVYRAQFEPERLLLSRGGEQIAFTCRHEGDMLEIEGVLDGSDVHWQLTRTAPPGLLSHGFHWVTESPHRLLPDPDRQTGGR